jgi:hypothetical protein
VDKTLSVMMELPLVPVVLMEQFLLLDQHSAARTTKMNLISII